MTKAEDERMSGKLADIAFDCEGKCRICPFPGFNCARHQMQSEKMTQPKKFKSEEKSKKDAGESNVSGYKNKL